MTNKNTQASTLSDDVVVNHHGTSGPTDMSVAHQAPPVRLRVTTGTTVYEVIVDRIE